MPLYCAAYDCSNSKHKEGCKGKSFFRFPIKNNQLTKLWLLKLRRVNFTPTENSVLCSDHFDESCFRYQNFTNRRELKKGSVPTIFSHIALSRHKTSKELEQLDGEEKARTGTNYELREAKGSECIIAQQEYRKSPGISTVLTGPELKELAYIILCRETQTDISLDDMKKLDLALEEINILKGIIASKSQETIASRNTKTYSRMKASASDSNTLSNDLREECGAQIESIVKVEDISVFEENPYDDSIRVILELEQKLAIANERLEWLETELLTVRAENCNLKMAIKNLVKTET